MTQMDKPQRVWSNDTEVDISAHDRMPDDESVDDRRRLQITRTILDSYQENERRRWFPMNDGGYETRVRDDVKVIVRWFEKPGYPAQAYAIISNPFGAGRVRVNPQTMADLDELIRLLSIRPWLPGPGEE